MSNETPRLGLRVYDSGDTNWDHTDTVTALDEYAIRTGSIEDRPDGTYDDELYAAVDQRILWRWDAEEEDWDPIGGFGTESDPVPGEVYYESVTAEHVRVGRVSNEIYANHQPGSTLSEKIRNALSKLPDGRGCIRVTPPDGDDPWEWGEQLTIPAAEYNGIEIDIATGTEIIYRGSEWAIYVDGTDSRQRNEVTLSAENAEFVAKGNPNGFLRVADLSQLTVKVDTRHFRNDTGNATCILIGNIGHWCEGWRIEGDHRDCDRGIDFAPASVTGGDGTDSFVDGEATNVSVNYHDFGVRLRGNHRSNTFSNLRLFPKSDGAVGLQLSGFLDQTTFRNVRWDDTPPKVDDVGIVTHGLSGKPIFIAPSFSDVDTTAITDDQTDDLWAVKTEGSQIGFEDLESGSSFYVSRSGGFTISRGSEEAIWRTDGNGNICEGGNWKCGSPPSFSDGWKQKETDLTAVHGSSPRQVLFHDGSNGYPRDYYWWNGSDGKWVRIGDESTEI